jgi:hypothetical protein
MSKVKRSAALVAVVAAAGAAVIGNAARGLGAEPAPAHPEWFQNVHKSYGFDPRLTPDFDFASLYTAEVPSIAHRGVPESTG